MPILLKFAAFSIFNASSFITRKNKENPFEKVFWKVCSLNS